MGSDRGGFRKITYSSNFKASPFSVIVLTSPRSYSICSHLSSTLSYLFNLTIGISLMEMNSLSSTEVSFAREAECDDDHPAFSRSLEAFRRRLSAEDIEKLELTTFEDLQNAIRQVQSDQAQRRTLRNLNKIKPLLHFLQDYARVIEQFVSVKPDFLAFIWVDAKFLLSQACHPLTPLPRDPSSYASRYAR